MKNILDFENFVNEEYSSEEETNEAFLGFKTKKEKFEELKEKGIKNLSEDEVVDLFVKTFKVLRPKIKYWIEQKLINQPTKEDYWNCLENAYRKDYKGRIGYKNKKIVFQTSGLQKIV